jgi:hypothetical protein
VLPLSGVRCLAGGEIFKADGEAFLRFGLVSALAPQLGKL